MAKFITVTDYNYDRKVSINLDYVISFEPYKPVGSKNLQGSRLIATNGDLYVSETVEEIKMMIEEDPA